MFQACDTTVSHPSRPFVPALEPTAHRPERVWHAVVLAICVSTLALAFLLRPGADGASLLGYAWPWRCWLHDTFGIKCALCGLTRSFCSLARGDLAAGMAFHRLGPLVFGLFCLEVPYRIYALAIQRRVAPRLVRGHNVIVGLVGLALVTNWLLYLGELIA